MLNLYVIVHLHLYNVKMQFSLIVVLTVWLKVFTSIKKSCFAEQLWIYRTSRRSQMFLKRGVLKNFGIFTKHLCWSLFLIKLQAQIFKNSFFTGHFFFIAASGCSILFHKILDCKRLLFKLNFLKPTLLSEELI